jgi:hypothetical protein
MTHLVDDLVLEIPWEDKDNVGSSFVDGFDGQYWYVTTGRIPPVLIRVAIDSIRKKIRAYSTIV